MIPTLYENYRHWSDGRSVYILSDLHFDDAIGKDMVDDWLEADKLVDKINSIVGKNDTFIGRFIRGALSQKGMVTDEIYRSGNNLAGFSKVVL